MWIGKLVLLKVLGKMNLVVNPELEMRTLAPSRWHVELSGLRPSGQVAWPCTHKPVNYCGAFL